MSKKERRFTPKFDAQMVMKATSIKDPLVAVYMRDVDRTLLRENLKLTYQQRFEKHQRALEMVRELQRAGRKIRCKDGVEQTR